MFNRLILLLVLSTLTVCGDATAASKGQVFDALLVSQRAGGVTLAGGKAYFYVPGTTTYKAIYADRNKTTPAANPYTLSADGTAMVYGDGLYDVKVTNSALVQKYLWEDVQLTDYGSPDTSTGILVQETNGTYTSAASLSDANTNVDYAGKTIVVTTPTSLTANITLAADRVWQFKKGAIVTTTGYTMTVKGPFKAGRYQVFDGTGTVAFDTGSVTEAYPEWTGAKTEAESAGFDSGPAVRKLATFTGVPEIKFGPGQYNIGVIAPEGAYLRVTDAVTTGYGVRLQKGIKLTSSTYYKDSSYSTGDIRTTINVTGSAAESVGIYLDASNISVSGLNILVSSGWGIRGWGAYNDISENTITAAKGIHIKYSLHTGIIHNAINAPGAGILVDRGTSTEIVRNYINGFGFAAGANGIKMGDPTTSATSGDTTICSGNITGNIIEYYDNSIYLSPAHGTLDGVFSASQFLSQQIVMTGNYYESMGTTYLYALDANFISRDNITLSASGTGKNYNVQWSVVQTGYRQISIMDGLHVPTMTGLFIGNVEGAQPSSANTNQIVIQPGRSTTPAIRLFTTGLVSDDKKAEIEMGDTFSSLGWRVRYDRALSASLRFISYDAGVETTAMILRQTIPTYADNAAATAAGLEVGTVYRTATGVLMIRY